MRTTSTKTHEIREHSPTVEQVRKTSVISLSINVRPKVSGFSSSHPTWPESTWRRPHLRRAGESERALNIRKEGDCNRCTTSPTPILSGIEESSFNVANQVVCMNRPDPAARLPFKHKLGQHNAKMRWIGGGASFLSKPPSLRFRSRPRTLNSDRELKLDERKQDETYAIVLH